MEGSMEMISVVVGTVVGIILSSTVWSLVITGRAKKEDKAKEQRDQIISSIAEILADIDRLLASNFSGQLKDNSLDKSLSSRIEAINKILNSSMHNLDVYYVKYIESLLDQFYELICDESEESSVPAVSEKTQKAETPQVKPIIKTETVKVSEQISPAKVDNKEKIIEKAPETKQKEEIPQKQQPISSFEKEFEEAAKIERPDPFSPRKIAPEEEFAVETIMDFDISSINKMKQEQLKADTSTNLRIQSDEPQFEIKEKPFTSKPAKVNIEEEATSKKSQPDISKKAGQSDSETKKFVLTPAVKSQAKTNQPDKPIESKEASPVIEDEQEVDLSTFFEVQTDGNDAEKKDVNITGEDIEDQIDSFFNINKK
jgi:hypothetical protein